MWQAGAGAADLRRADVPADCARRPRLRRLLRRVRPGADGPGRQRALWAYGLSSISEANFSVYTGAAGQRRERLVANLSEDAEKFSGLPMAGDGRHLVYANREEWSPTSIGVFRVVDGGLILMRLRGTGQASGLTVALALDRERVALARVSMRADPPPDSWPIEIRSLPSGARVSSFDAGELPRAVAFSGSRVALLFGGEGENASRVDVRTTGGSLLSSFAVPRPTFDEISMSGRWLVFRTRALSAPST